MTSSLSIFVLSLVGLTGGLTIYGKISDNKNYKVAGLDDKKG